MWRKLGGPMRSLKFKALVTTTPPDDEDNVDPLPCSLT